MEYGLVTAVVSPAEFARLTGEPAAARSKYGARKCTLHQPPHDSLKECRRYIQLELLQRAGYVRDLRQQVVFELAPSVTLWGRKRPPLKYIADFCYEEHLPDGTWQQVTEDCKGVQTPVFRLKAHLLAAQGRIVRLT